MDPNMPGMDPNMPGMDGGDSSMPDMPGMGNTMPPARPPPFCSGQGTVMYNGFNFIREAPVDGSMGGNCMLFIFQDAIVDTEAKYIAAIVGAFFFAVVLEGLRNARILLRRKRNHIIKRHGVVIATFLEALLFGIHMVDAYIVMLIVMLYESAMFIATILGLVVGYFVFELLMHVHEQRVLERQEENEKLHYHIDDCLFDERDSEDESSDSEGMEGKQERGTIDHDKKTKTTTATKSFPPLPTLMPTNSSGTKNVSSAGCPAMIGSGSISNNSRRVH